MRDKLRDDHMLVTIEPTSDWPGSGAGTAGVRHLILASYLRGETLFPVTRWPCLVSVAHILDERVRSTRTFTSSQVEYVAKGAIHATFADAQAKVNRLATRFYHGLNEDRPSHYPAAERRQNVQHFIVTGELNGPLESELKAGVTPILLKHVGALRAYLASIRYEGDSEDHVVLCVVREAGDDGTLVRGVSEVVSAVFKSYMYIDIVFVKPEEEFAIAVGCRPFFNRAHLQPRA